MVRDLARVFLNVLISLLILAMLGSYARFAWESLRLGWGFAGGEWN